MIVIRHRVNTIAQMEETPSGQGVEIDLRDYDGRIVLQHEPLRGGEALDDYLDRFRHRFLIANIKCEGIEDAVLDALARRNVRDFFLLDLSFPALVRLARRGERRLALRWSEFEPLEACAPLRGRIQWLWVDCFSSYPVAAPALEPWLDDFKLCLVSPELQGRVAPTRGGVQELMERYRPHAVCTKTPDSWITATENTRAEATQP